MTNPTWVWVRRVDDKIVEACSIEHADGEILDSMLGSGNGSVVVHDRDLNAAVNIARLGCEALGLKWPGSPSLQEGRHHKKEMLNY